MQQRGVSRIAIRGERRDRLNGVGEGVSEVQQRATPDSRRSQLALIVLDDVGFHAHVAFNELSDLLKVAPDDAS